MSTKLLEKLGLTSLITKITNTFAKKSDTYTRTEIDADLNLKQNKLTFDDSPTQGSLNPVRSNGIYVALSTKQNSLEEAQYFPDGDGDSKRIKATYLNNFLFTLFPALGWINNTNDGYICFGRKKGKTTSSGSDTVEPRVAIVYGKITKVITKINYDQNNYSYSSNANKFTFPSLFTNTHKKIRAITFVEDYNSQVSASPLRFVPAYQTVDNESVLGGFYAIHDTSDSITGYYIAVIGKDGDNEGV